MEFGFDSQKNIAIWKMLCHDRRCTPQIIEIVTGIHLEKMPPAPTQVELKLAEAVVNQIFHFYSRTMADGFLHFADDDPEISSTDDAVLRVLRHDKRCTDVVFEMITGLSWSEQIPPPTTDQIIRARPIVNEMLGYIRGTMPDGFQQDVDEVPFDVHKYINECVEEGAECI